MSDLHIVVVGTHSAPTFAVYQYLAERFGVDRLVLETPESKKLILKRRIKKLGVVRAGGQLAFQLLVAPALRHSSAARVRAIQEEFQLNTSAPAGDAISRVGSINSPEAIQLLKELGPRLIVVAGTRILSKQFLGSAQCPVVNIHAGITPLYRGVHGAYWALVERRPDLCGVTVHRVDAGIDTGEVLAQRLIHTTELDNFVTYPWIQLGEGLKALAELLPEVVSGERIGVPAMSTESRLRYHPTFWDYLRYRIRDGVK